ncbi:MAG: hypothetical protein KKA76_03020 [Proteobacteria bacterium]|nr:hypothetical protein [Pseudomonadota bacterium]
MMLRNTLALLLIVGLGIPAALAFGAAHPELKHFPAPKEGMERFVIVLEQHEQDKEDSCKVEIIAGKEMLTDGVNLVRLGTTIEPHTLNGWGYTYYEVTGSSGTMSTMMAPPEGAAMVKKFVTTAPLHVPYNSRLPIVIYVPKGYEVQYRIWKASELVRKAVNR